MATDIDQQASAVAMTLMAKYEVDRDSIQEVKREVEDVEKQMQSIRLDMSRSEKQQFVAFREEMRDSELEKLNQVERAVMDHWSRRLQIVRGNAEEEKRIMEALSTDLVKLEEMRSRAIQSVDNQAAASAGVTGDSSMRAATGGMGLQGVLGPIGWGSILQLGSFAAMAGLVASSVAQLRDARTEAREVGEMAMRDSDFSFGLAPAFQQLRRRSGGDISFDDFGRVASEIAPFAPGGLAGGRQLGDVTEQAFQLGTAYGVDPQQITRLMRQFSILEGTAFPNLIQRVFDVARSAEEAGIPMRDFAPMLSTAVEEGRRYNRTIPEQTQLITQFGRQIQDGTISVRELTQAQQAAGNAQPGVQALLGEQFLNAGGRVGTFLRGVGATDPYAASVAVRALAQGALPTAEGDFIGPSEQTAAQQRDVAAMRSDITRAMPAMIQQMAQSTGATGLAGAGIMQQMLSSMMGLQGGTMAATADLFDWSQGAHVAGRARMAPAGHRPRTLEETLAEGDKSITDAVSMLDKFKNAVGSTADWIALTGQLLIAKVRGDTEAVARIEEQLDQFGVAGSGKTGKEWVGESKIVGGASWLLNSPFNAGRSLGENVKVIIENRAPDQVDVRSDAPSEKLIPQH